MPDAHAVFERLAGGPLKALSADERAVFRDRVDVHWNDVLRPLRALYGDREDFARLPQRVLRAAARAYANRPRSLREWDLRRLNEPDGFQRSTHVGYLCDAARFGGDLKGVTRRAGYFEALGITLVHLPSLLQPRDGDSDRGRALKDHRRVDPRVGAMGDLAALARRLRRGGIALGTDLVVDRTAREHGWAQKALAGEERYRDYYLTYPDRELPDQFERTVADVHPQTAGNFTWVESLERWVWTSYDDFQWDLNYANADVFIAMLEALLHLANRGASLVRLVGLDRSWKTLGTSCSGLPETASLLQAWRALCRVAAPGVLLWADDGDPARSPQLALGAGAASGKQAQLATHRALPMMLWSSLAEQNVRLATQVLNHLSAAPDDTAWLLAARDDGAIDWHLDHRDADAVGLGAAAHRRFLAEFYSGAFPGSFGRGVNVDSHANFGDWRTRGTAAALCGLVAARESGDGDAVELAVRRLGMVYGVLFAFGGIPVIAMGDELGLENPDAALDWAAAEQRDDEQSLVARLFKQVAALIEARREAFVLHAGAATRVVATGNDRVLGVLRSSARGRLLVLANSSDQAQTVSRFELGSAGLPDGCRDLLTPDEAAHAEVPQVGVPEGAVAPAADGLRGDVTLRGYQVRWLVPA
ncbi:MAG: alpha-amylase family glycosyl hydrolase [Pseudomonadota bacterium]